MSEQMSAAGTCVALPIGDQFKAVLLRGAPGAGKSDLALRLIDGGARLVADDRVLLEEQAGVLIARAPLNIRARMEVRGVGILAVDAVEAATLVLLVDLVALKEVPRLPEAAFEFMANVKLPRLNLFALESSAPAKIRLAVQALSGRPVTGVTFPFAFG